MSERDIKDDTVAKWRAWARKLYGDNDGAVDAAAEAAVTVLRKGGSPGDAVKAGRAAADRLNRTNAPPRTKGSDARQLPPAFGHTAPAGSIVGYARNVAKEQQIVTGLQVLSFQVEIDDGTLPVTVQMRGPFFDGVVKDGDIVEVPTAGRTGLVQTDCAFNRSKNCEIRVRRGWSAQLSQYEAKWGSTRPIKAVAGVAVVWIVLLFAGVVTFGVVLVSMLINSRSDPIPTLNNDPHPPPGYCADATELGVSAPGC